MPASYPSSVKTYTTKIDNVDYPQAAHINELQDEVTAVEQGLLNGFQHTLKPLTDASYDLGASTLRWRRVYLGETATADVQALNISETWNAAAVAFTLIKANVTDTASAAGSLLLDLQVGGASKFKVDKAGAATLASQMAVGAGINNQRQLYLAGTFSGAQDANAIGIDTTVASAAGFSARGISIEAKYQKAGTGTHPLFTGLWIRTPSTLDHGPNILSGAASIDSVAGLYLSGRPSGGTNNYAIWVEDGHIRLGGGLATFEETTGGGLTLGGVTPEKKLDVRVGTGTSVTNPRGVGLFNTQNAVGETVGITLNFNNTVIPSAALTAVQADTAQQSADLAFVTRNASGVTAERWRLTSAGVLRPAADAAYDLGTATARVRDLYLSGLASNGGARFRHARSMVAVSRSSNQTIPYNTWTAISWDVEEFDNDFMHSADNPTRLVAPIPGKYLLTTTVWLNLASNTKYLRVMRNNTTPLGRSFFGGYSAEITLVAEMWTNDFIEVQVLHLEDVTTVVVQGNNNEYRITRAELVYLGE